MELIAVRTPILKENDDLTAIISESADIAEGDIIAISSKAIATVEGAAIDLSKIEITDEAKEWADKLNRTKRDPAFRQAVLNEAKRLNGEVLSGCSQAMLTDVKPVGLMEGSLLVPNAGLDQSNVKEGFAIGWPEDPVKSVQKLYSDLTATTGKKLGILMTDSGCRPRRIGVTAIALTICGFDPLEDQIGKPDLFDRDMLMTQEARADQLATAANFLMGNSDESIPVVVIRDHGLSMTDYCGWVPCIEKEEDLFSGSI